MPKPISRQPNVRTRVARAPSSRRGTVSAARQGASVPTRAQATLPASAPVVADARPGGAPPSAAQASHSHVAAAPAPAPRAAHAEGAPHLAYARCGAVITLDQVLEEVRSRYAAVESHARRDTVCTFLTAAMAHSGMRHIITASCEWLVDGLLKLGLDRPAVMREVTNHLIRAHMVELAGPGRTLDEIAPGYENWLTFFRRAALADCDKTRCLPAAPLVSIPIVDEGTSSRPTRPASAGTLVQPTWMLYQPPIDDLVEMLSAAWNVRLLRSGVMEGNSWIGETPVSFLANAYAQQVIVKQNPSWDILTSGDVQISLRDVRSAINDARGDSDIDVRPAYDALDFLAQLMVDRRNADVRRQVMQSCQTLIECPPATSNADDSRTELVRLLGAFLIRAYRLSDRTAQGFQSKLLEVRNHIVCQTVADVAARALQIGAAGAPSPSTGAGPAQRPDAATVMLFTNGKVTITLRDVLARLDTRFRENEVARTLAAHCVEFIYRTIDETDARQNIEAVCQAAWRRLPPGVEPNEFRAGLIEAVAMKFLESFLASNLDPSSFGDLAQAGSESPASSAASRGLPASASRDDEGPSFASLADTDATRSSDPLAAPAAASSASAPLSRVDGGDSLALASLNPTPEDLRELTTALRNMVLQDHFGALPEFEPSGHGASERGAGRVAGVTLATAPYVVRVSVPRTPSNAPSTSSQ